jgi:hypothetical protein
MDNSYDSVGEYYLLYKYFKHYRQIDRDNIHKIVIEKLNDMVTTFNNQIKRNVITIHIRQLYFELENIINLLKTDKDRYAKHFTNFINFIRDCYFITDTIKIVYKMQYNTIKKSNILSSDKIKEQIKSFENGSDNLTFIKHGTINLSDTFYNKLLSCIDLISN